MRALRPCFSSRWSSFEGLGRLTGDFIKYTRCWVRCHYGIVMPRWELDNPFLVPAANLELETR